MSQRLPVVLMWHLHQPQYRDALTGEYVLPWTYLHALKDYSDMAAHLEENPAARAVVGRGRAPHLEEDVVEQVLGLAAVLEDPQAERHQRGGVAIVQRGQRLAITRGHRLDQGDVGFVVGRGVGPRRPRGHGSRR